MKTFMKIFKKALKWLALVEFVIYPAVLGYSVIINWVDSHGANNFGEVIDKSKACGDYFSHEIEKALKTSWKWKKAIFKKALKKLFKKA